MTKTTQTAETLNTFVVEANEIEDFVVNLAPSNELILKLENKISALKQNISDAKSSLKASVSNYIEDSEGSAPVDVEGQKELISDMNFDLARTKSQLKLVKSVASAYNRYQNPEQK